MFQLILEDWVRSKQTLLFLNNLIFLEMTTKILSRIKNTFDAEISTCLKEDGMQYFCFEFEVLVIPFF